MANYYLYCNGEGNTNRWLQKKSSDNNPRLYAEQGSANIEKIDTGQGSSYYIKVNGKYLEGNSESGKVTVTDFRSEASKWVEELHNGNVIHLRLYNTGDNVKSYLRGATASGKKGKLEMRKDKHAAQGTQWVWI